MRGRFLGRVGRSALLTLIAGAAAGCGADVSRFGENPFGNPFSSRSDTPAATGALATKQAGAPVGAVRSSALGAPRQALPARPAVNAGAGIGQASSWTAQGGTPVTIGQGESVMTLADRYGVPPQALLSANGLSSASQAQPGQQIVIPVFQGAKSAATAAAASPQPRSLPPVAAPQQRLSWKKGAGAPAKDDDEDDVRPAKVASAPAKKPASPKLAKATTKDEDEAPAKVAPKVAGKAAGRPPKGGLARTRPGGVVRQTGRRPHRA